MTRNSVGRDSNKTASPAQLFPSFRLSGQAVWHRDAKAAGRLCSQESELAAKYAGKFGQLEEAVIGWRAPLSSEVGVAADAAPRCCSSLPTITSI